MKNLVSYIALAGAVIAIVLVLVGNQPAPMGASTGQAFWGTASFLQGLNAGTRNQMTISNAGALTTSGAITGTGDATISGGTLNVTHSNTATSTIIGGCFQFYATSTATAMNFTASTTPGIMYSSYGACPNL